MWKYIEVSHDDTQVSFIYCYWFIVWFSDIDFLSIGHPGNTYNKLFRSVVDNLQIFWRDNPWDNIW